MIVCVVEELENRDDREMEQATFSLVTIPERCRSRVFFFHRVGWHVSCLGGVYLAGPPMIVPFVSYP